MKRIIRNRRQICISSKKGIRTQNCSMLMLKEKEKY